ncbi:hypothetical protein CG015_17500 [Vibrio anguillarum]|nr:hypothetical protein CG015_17500 [Vibrio anguillarum]
MPSILNENLGQKHFERQKLELGNKEISAISQHGSVGRTTEMDMVSKRKIQILFAQLICSEIETNAIAAIN